MHNLFITVRMVGQTSKVTNEHVNIKAPLYTECTLMSETAEALNALGLSDTALANWHKWNRHLRGLVFQANPRFHESLLSIAKKKCKPSTIWSETERMWTASYGIVMPSVEGHGKQRHFAICSSSLASFLDTSLLTSRNTRVSGRTKMFLLNV